ncbi:unnamed protein product [Lepeophtheirus salmonis]|uniref:(salmon louse) hypothetical protein n=1 Tax=Lepeophtheirus salmonis TaxID=72036 RepID=A0A7R8HC42_LEPSM|nr:unnamed protein product [Lepeophtheirus salmonis]CAF2999481.1 unnamed protein product [Lepeophtheirus salmonis]
MMIGVLLLLCLSLSVSSEIIKVGDIITKGHGVKGAPDAFFMGKFYEYNDPDTPIIEGVHTGSKIVLTLPSDNDVSDYKWFSVWCRAYNINFGDVYFPESLEVAEGESEPEAEIPSPIAPISNDISGHKDHEYHHGDHSEAESHAEDEPLPGSASFICPSVIKDHTYQLKTGIVPDDAILVFPSAPRKAKKSFILNPYHRNFFDEKFYQEGAAWDSKFDGLQDQKLSGSGESLDRKAGSGRKPQDIQRKIDGHHKKSMQRHAKDFVISSMTVSRAVKKEVGRSL